MRSYSIIGNGKMAHFLAQSLKDSGLQLQYVWARDAVKAEHFAQQYGARTCEDIRALPDQEDHFCFLAVSDAALPIIASTIRFKHSMLVHHAGSVSSGVLLQAADNFGVLWPIYSITGDQHTRTKDIPFVVEANNARNQQKLQQLASLMSTKIFELNEQQRFKAHLSAVLCNNFCNHLIAIAQEICEEDQINAQCLQPIIQQTLTRLDTNKAADVQTGPAIRNDQTTMQLHLNLLQEKPEWHKLYEILSSSIVKMYKRDSE